MTALTVAGSAVGARRRDAEGTGVADELEVETRGYARTLVRVGLLLRLVALAAALVGVVGPDTPRDVLGLMMAGISYEDAVATVEESHE